MVSRVVSLDEPSTTLSGHEYLKLGAAKCDSRTSRPREFRTNSGGHISDRQITVICNAMATSRHWRSPSSTTGS